MDTITQRQGNGGLNYFYVNNRFASAKLTSYGAHLMEYVPSGQPPVLWMSQKSNFAPDKAIRGGVPVCWPYFGANLLDPSLPAHGFARIREWEVAELRDLDDGASFLAFRLPPGQLPAPYQMLAATMEFYIGAELRLKLSMKNLDDKPQEISCALHSYFAVGDCEKIKISGLSGAKYYSKVDDCDFVQSEPEIIIDREVDRIYESKSRCVVTDPVLKRAISIDKCGSDSTVVWNPWIAKSRNMPDFGDEEYHTMVCVETANARFDTRILQSGETHAIEAIIKSYKI